MFFYIKVHYLIIINFKINVFLSMINFTSFLKIFLILFLLVFSFTLIVVVIFLNSTLSFYLIHLI